MISKRFSNKGEFINFLLRIYENAHSTPMPSTLAGCSRLSENKVPFLLFQFSSQQKRGLFLYGIIFLIDKHSLIFREMRRYFFSRNNSDSLLLAAGLLDGRAAARRGEGVPEDEDDGIAPEEHLGDVPVLVHRLRLLLA